ncbi:MAG: DDE-type integrase/transposase/recombinase [Gammaproteobacteria bacterium]|nr:DDE-type integrase/transposase/recombinase [Gammaproteobacteria bacterium]MBL4882786.1 DDE-type integrase/transposase/recombinase [Oleispira sp.]
MFQINEVVLLEGKKYRVLLIEGSLVIWIDIESDKALPEIEPVENIEQLILEEKLVRIEDPYDFLSLENPEKESKAALIRDRNYDLIKPLVNSSRFYIPKVRSSIINEILETQSTTKQTIYRVTRQYWQYGQMPNALLPKYRNSGAKGKKRQSTIKLGRPRIHMPGTGVVVDEAIEKLFRLVIERYLLTEGQGEEKVSLPYVHRKLKQIYGQYFPDTPEKEKPTKWQLKYFFEREYDYVSRITKRTPQKIYRKDVRPLTSTATVQSVGPGSRFEIDATIADIILVSDKDRTQPIGRPILYIVVDVFSRFIVGWYIGFENPSYAAAIQSLHLAMTDKNEYLKARGFNIENLEWPNPGLPEALLADRGELIGHQIEGLESSFKIRIENTPPYRGDAKGIVERKFRSVQADFKPFAPGIVEGSKVRKRGGKNYWLDGKLTISEFEEIIITSIVMHNFVDPMSKYDRSDDMPADLPSIPCHLWSWGLQNRTGRLRRATASTVRIALLPRGIATTSEKGVCAFGLYYSSAEVLASGWLHRVATTNRPEKITFAYDPNVADEIYVFSDSNALRYWICKLTDLSREYRGSSFWEVWRKQKLKKEAFAKQQLVADKSRAEYENRIESIIKSAVKETPAPTMANSERLANVGKARFLQLEKERKQKRPKPPGNSLTANVTSIHGSLDEDDDYPDYDNELFDDGDN